MPGELERLPLTHFRSRTRDRDNDLISIALTTLLRIEPLIGIVHLTFRHITKPSAVERSQ